MKVKEVINVNVFSSPFQSKNYNILLNSFNLHTLLYSPIFCPVFLFLHRFFHLLILFFITLFNVDFFSVFFQNPEIHIFDVLIVAFHVSVTFYFKMCTILGFYSV
jgi:hypothetical protein